MKKTVILLAAMLMASTAAHAGALGEATHNLSVNMTEQGVINFLSNYPYKVSLMTCGSDTPQPWQCKMLTFTGPHESLTVLLSQRDDGSWKVESWF